MIDIFKKKTIYKFSARTQLDRWALSKVELYDTDSILFLAKHAKKQFRWARKDEGGTSYHYYLDEKHMMYIDLAWPPLSRAIRGLQND